MPLIVLNMQCLEESDSSDSDNSNDKCERSNKDFRGFYNQRKLHTAMPFCWVSTGNLSFKCVQNTFIPKFTF
jgi:hypothetical protein